MGEPVDLGPGMACPVRSRNARIAELEEKLRVLTIQNNARATVIAGHQALGWDRHAENSARQQLDGERETNARLTDEVERLEAENARLRTVTPAMIAAAWATWKPRHKDRLGPGPAFREAIEAAIAAAGVPVRGEEG